MAFFVDEACQLTDFFVQIRLKIELILFAQFYVVEVEQKASFADAHDVCALLYGQLIIGLHAYFPPFIDDLQHLPYGFSSLGLLLPRGHRVELKLFCRGGLFGSSLHLVVGVGDYWQ